MKSQGLSTRWTLSQLAVESLSATRMSATGIIKVTLLKLNTKHPEREPEPMGIPDTVTDFSAELEKRGDRWVIVSDKMPLHKRH
jgi:hypothetical protein